MRSPDEEPEMFDDPIARDELAEDDAPEPGANLDLFAVYLREMGAIPLLEKDEEVRLARELHEGREQLARLLLELPPPYRNAALTDAVRRRRPAAWSLAELDASYEQLSSFVEASPRTRHPAKLQEARRLKRQVDRSREAMIVANLRLVTHVAKKYTNQGMAFADLVQEGNIGLMRAVEKFEYKKGYKFSTYAYWWIKQAISRALADKSRTIRIPVHLAEKLKRIQRASAELGEELGRPPTAREIARKARTTVRQVDELLGAGNNP